MPDPPAAPAEPRPRGRPRSEKSRQAIPSGAAELLRQRPLSEISVEAIAERAGASKATIYRWWPSKEVLALDAVLAEWAIAEPAEVDHGSLRADLRAIVLPWVRLLRGDQFGRVIAALTAEVQRRDPVFLKTYYERFVAPRRAPARAALMRAIERGDMPRDADVDVALDLLYGAIYHRLLHLHAPLTERFGAAVVDGVVAAVGHAAG